MTPKPAASSFSTRLATSASMDIIPEAGMKNSTAVIRTGCIGLARRR